MIDFRYLPAFFAVAEFGNFSEAAKKLFIATSAVSRQIRLLEESCETQLFFRTSRETTLTEAGPGATRDQRIYKSNPASCTTLERVIRKRLGAPSLR